MRSGEPEFGSCSCCCLACSSTNSARRFGPRKKLEERFAAFAVGRWAELFRASREADVQASAHTVRRRRREFTDDLSRRVQRAVSFVQMGVVSSQASIGGSSVGSWIIDPGSPHQPRQKTFCTSRIFGKRDRGTRPCRTLCQQDRGASGTHPHRVGRGCDNRVSGWNWGLISRKAMLDGFALSWTGRATSPFCQEFLRCTVTPNTSGRRGRTR